MGTDKTDTESNSDRPEPTDNHTFAAEQLLDADSPVVIIGKHAYSHETAMPAREIAETVAADLIVDEQIGSAPPAVASYTGALGSLSENEQRARHSETMLVVGYEIDELDHLPYEDYDGYAIQIAPGDRNEWIEYRAELSDQQNVLSQCASDLTLLGNPAEDATLLARATTQVARERAQSESEDDESITVYGAPDNDLPATPPRDEVELGDTYRVSTVKKCAVCHTKTNKREITPSSRLHCPAARGGHLTAELPVERPEEHDKHKQLTELLDRREELKERLEDYNTDTESADRTVQRIHDELETIDATVQELREWFDGRFDDVEGVDPDQQGVPTFSP